MTGKVVGYPGSVGGVGVTGKTVGYPGIVASTGISGGVLVGAISTTS